MGPQFAPREQSHAAGKSPAKRSSAAKADLGRDQEDTVLQPDRYSVPAFHLADIHIFSPPPNSGPETPEMPAGAILLQRKLAVSSTTDPLEAEADAVAAQVMDGSAAMGDAQRGAAGPLPQGRSAAGVILPKMTPRSRAVGEATPREAPSAVEETLRSPGQRLERSVRMLFEPRFGRDFGDVRVHTDQRAAESAKSVAARAYAAGPHIVFGAGQYDPQTKAGLTLMAHELAHTVQQRAVAPLVQRQQAKGSGHEELDKAIDDRDWEAAAEILNGYNADAIKEVLARVPRGVAASIYVGATKNPRVGPESAAAEWTRSYYLDINYDNEVKRTDWKAAAKYLNGFSRADIQKHLDKLDAETIKALHDGAVANDEVGDKSNVAVMTDQMAQAKANREKNKTVPMGTVLGEDKTVPYSGDPQKDAKYIEKTTVGIGLPIWGGPYYLKQSKNSGWTDSIVVPRSDIYFDGDPMAEGSIEISMVYTSREAALAAVANSGLPHAYTFYKTATGVIVPTVVSATTAPAVASTAQKAREQERVDAKAAEKLSTELLVWYIGARFPVKVGSVEGGAGAATQVAKSSLQEVLGETEYAALKAAAEAAKAANPSLAALTTDEIIALRAYSGESWAMVNQALRLKDAKELTKLDQFISLMKSGLQKLPIFKGTVQRTIAMDVTTAVERYKVGATVVEDAFTSTTSGASVAQREGNVLLKIVSETGRDISAVAKHKEAEILFAPGARFLVTEAKQVGNAVLVTMKEVL